MGSRSSDGLCTPPGKQRRADLEALADSSFQFDQAYNAVMYALATDP